MRAPERTDETVVAPHVRNFCIIAHIDHGKTTLSDRLLEITKTIACPQTPRSSISTRWTSSASAGITIKAHPVTLSYPARDGRHVRTELDRHAGPRRLLVGGVAFAGRLRGRAAGDRRLAGHRSADAGELSPRAGARPDDHPGRQQDRPAVGRSRAASRARSRTCSSSIAPRRSCAARRRGSASRTSSRRSSAVSRRRRGAATSCAAWSSTRSSTRIAASSHTCASWTASCAPGRASCPWRTSERYECTEVGVFKPDMRRTKSLEVGNVGYVIANIRSLGDIDVGDTITESDNPAPQPLRGYRPVVPMVYCGLYPNEGAEYSQLRDALEKLKLNDAALRLRAGEFGRARLRLPLRLPRAAAHGDRPRAARTQLQHRHHRDVAVGRVSRNVDRRPGAVDRQPVAAARGDIHRNDRGAVRQGDDPDAARVRRIDHGTHPKPARNARHDGLPARRPRA